MIKIHTLKWKGSRPATDADDEANVTIHCRVFVDGTEIPNVTKARVLFDNQGFSEAMIRLIGPVEVVNHTQESWEAL